MGFTLGMTLLSAISSSEWAECVLQILAVKHICKAMVKEALGICMSTPALHSEMAKVFVTGTSVMCTPDSGLCVQGLLSKLADVSGMWPYCTSPAGRCTHPAIVSGVKLRQGYTVDLIAHMVGVGKAWGLLHAA